jgi:hypothetical protein
MAKEGGGPPLPRRVPGAADSPRPPARVKPPVLPESLLQRLRAEAEVAEEEEAACAQGENAPGPAAAPGVSVPLPRRPPGRHGTPGPPAESGSAPASSAGRGRVPPEALTEPIPALSPAMLAGLEETGIAGAAAPPASPAPADAPAPPAVPAPSAAPARQNGTAGRDVPRREDGPSRPDLPARRNDAAGPDAPRQQDGLSRPDLPRREDGSPRPDVPEWRNGTAGPDALRRQDGSSRPDVPARRNGSAERDAPRQQDDAAGTDAPSRLNGAAEGHGSAQRDRPARHDRPVPPDPAAPRRPPTSGERAGPRAADAGAPPAGRLAGQQIARRRPVFGRRLQIAGVVVAVATLAAAGALILTLSGHPGKSAQPGGHRAGPGARSAAAVVRDQAAAWVAGQVSRTAVVSCDPVMCGALAAHGVPASDLDRIEPDTTTPLASVVVVATATVRAQFGNLLSSVYAPGVIARFGSGALAIEIRQIAPRGAAAYRSAMHADLMNRKASGAGLLLSSRIAASGRARRQLAAGQVDSRLIIAIAGMAAVRPIDIVAFGSFAPGASPDMPLRFAEVTQLSRTQPAATRSASPAFLRSMIGFLRSQPVHLGPAQTQTVRLAGGLTVLRVQFAAPSPLGLFSPH